MAPTLSDNEDPDFYRRPAPADLARLRDEIQERFEVLSGRLQDIGRYVLANPNDIAFGTTGGIAARAQVPPSALVRFAQFFGYSGFSEMQRLFREPLVARSPSYADRVRDLKLDEGPEGQTHIANVIEGLSGANIAALEHLSDNTPDRLIGEAVALINRARQVYLIGQRRSFPVATYLAYALPHAERSAHLLTGLGGLLSEQVRAIGRKDVLIAISFPPYSEETLAVATACQAAGAKVVALTDSGVSPLAKRAALLFEIRDAELFGFRSLTASMCLAQTLAILIAGERAKKARRGTGRT